MFRHLIKLANFLQPANLVQANLKLQNSWRSFSAFSNIIHNIIPQNKQLLQPSSPAANFDRGMKQMGFLKRRCKDCYFVMRQERLYVMCKTHPRHKQMSMKKRPKNTWTLTDATQSKKRAW